MGEGLQKADIDARNQRRVERADEILAFRQVYGYFAPDAAVDLRYESRRNLHVGHTAQIGGGDEPGQVADNPAAKRQDHFLAFRPMPREPMVDAFSLAQTLALFTGGHEIAKDRMAVLRKCLGNAVLGALHHTFIGDEEEPSFNAVARQDIRKIGQDVAAYYCVFDEVGVFDEANASSMLPPVSKECPPPPRGFCRPYPLPRGSLCCSTLAAHPPWRGFWQVGRGL